MNVDDHDLFWLDDWNNRAVAKCTHCGEKRVTPQDFKFFGCPPTDDELQFEADMISEAYEWDDSPMTIHKQLKRQKRQLDEEWDDADSEEEAIYVSGKLSGFIDAMQIVEDNSTWFTDREERLIVGAVKSQRFTTDEHYELYGKVCEWYAEEK